MRRVRQVLALAFALLAAAGARAEPAAQTPLVIDTALGPRRFVVDVARTADEQEVGLMFRRTLPSDGGMLFDFGKTRHAEFWMRNTLIPLDMLFIAADGHIADLHERAVPLSEAAIESKVPVRAVLEINGGTVSRLGIRLGDVVHHQVFGNGPGG